MPLEKQPLKLVGLDLGTSSVGWAFIEMDDSTGKIIAAGSRIFEPPVEDKTKTPKNKARRDARGARRIISRRKMRSKRLLRALIKLGVLPEDSDEQRKLCSSEDPYLLRCKGLDEKLEPYQFGRVMLHLNKRRGFKSNRKTDKKKESGKVLAAISELGKAIEETHSRTLGEYLYKHSPAKKRNRYTKRDMYRDELKILWDSQARFYDFLSPAEYAKIDRIIFFQRPLKIQKNLVGLCQLERWKTTRHDNGKEVMTGKKRAARSHPLFQRFRALQDINNISVDGRPLLPEQRELVYTAAMKNKHLTWGQLRKVAGIGKRAAINLEEGGKKKLHGARTECDLAKALGTARWGELDEKTRDDIYVALVTIFDEKIMLNRLTEGLRLALEEAVALIGVELEAGYGNLSLRAMKKLLPFMEEGLTYPDAVKKAGYGNSERLNLDLLPEPPHLPNPVVQKALYEVRKVINSIIRKHGKPDVIRVELAREMKQSKKQRIETQKEQKKREERNGEIRTKLKQAPFNIPAPKFADIVKYKLWEECKEICPYTGRAISAAMLFTHEVQVEHIIPFRRSADNSYMNKTVCMADENQAKNDRTPWEAYGGDSQRWEEISVRIKALPWPKQRKFMLKEIPDDLSTNQLNDTKYMSVETKKYLESLGVKVQAGKGGLTAMLRKLWGLNTTLPMAWDKNKKDRSDHRHHAVDAVAIALTSPSAVQKLTKVTLREDHIDHYPQPWHGFREEVEEKVMDIIVSHRVNRKISGALHEDTAYGPTGDPEIVVYRKKIEELTDKSIEKIRDTRIKNIIKKRIEESGIKTALKTDFFLPNRNGDPVPIKTVRLETNKTVATLHNFRNSAGEVYRVSPFGNNHHMEIIRNNKTGKYSGIVVTMMEAANRARREKRPMVQKDHGSEYTFVMSLSQNETIRIKKDDEWKYYRVQLMDAKSKNLTLKEHQSANIKDTDTRLFKCPDPFMKLNPEKVIISPLGEVYPTND